MKKLLSVLAFTIIASTSFLSCSKEKDNDDENCGVIYSVDYDNNGPNTIWILNVRYPNGDVRIVRKEVATGSFPYQQGNTYCK